MKYLLTHDFVNALGGAERCTAAIYQDVLHDEADIWVVGGNTEQARAVFDGHLPHALIPLDRLPAKVLRALAPVYYPWIRLMSPVDCDIIASSYAFSHLRRSSGRKIIYCHSPFRQIYSGVESYFRGGTLISAALRLLLKPFQRIDQKAAREADIVIATNAVVAARIEKYWGMQPSAIIPPPVDLAGFTTVSAPSRDYYLWAGRIVEPYKRLDIVLESFRQHPERRLVVAGDGRDRAAYARSYDLPNIEFVGQLKQEELSSAMANAAAVIFPSRDDFGMIPIEAMACGTPTIAFNGGGAKDTVSDSETGILFDEQSAESLSQGIDRFEHLPTISASVLREEAEQYSLENFTGKFRDALELS